MRLRNIAIFVCALALLLSGCSSPAATVTFAVHTATGAQASATLAASASLMPSHTVPPTATTAATTTAAPQPTYTPRPTKAPTASPTPTPTYDPCSGLPSNIETQLGKSFAETLTGIAQHLSDGRPAVEIPSRFSRKAEEGVIVAGDFKVKVWLLDLEGRGSEDVVVTIQQGTVLGGGSSGAFVLRQCPDGNHSVHYVSADPTSNLPFDYSYVDVTPARLLPDQSTQLIVTYGNILSGRCAAETYIVVGLEASGWKAYLQDGAGCGFRDATSVSHIVVLNPGPDGRKGLMLDGTRWTGWGIYQFASRGVRVFYGWNGSSLQYERRVLRPSVYRFHVLEDAQLALNDGEVALALENYQRAATDNLLRDSLSWFEFDTMDVNLNDAGSMAEAEAVAHRYQTAFAHFRVLVLSADTVQPNRLTQMVEQIAALYPRDSPANEFADLAALFANEFSKSGDTRMACQMTNTIVRSQYPNLTGPYGHVGNWGDEGAFTIETVCPEH